MPTLNKLEYLDETKHQIKEALNTNFDSQIQDDDTFRSYVSKISDIYTNWPKVEGEGIDLSLSNTKKGKMKVNLKGNTSQETTTQSANLFDEEYYNNDSLYSINAYKNTKLTRIKERGTLYFKAQLKTGKSEIGNFYLCLSNRQNPNTMPNNTAWAIYGTIVADGSTIQRNYETFNENDDLYFTYYPASVTLDTIFDTYDFLISTDNISYVPFVPDSPSPDYPQVIHTITGDNEVVVCGKNIWNEQWELGNINNDTGALETSTTFIRTKNHIEIEPNTTYYRTPSAETTRIFFYTENKTYISNVSVTPVGGTFTTPNNAKYLLFKQYGTTYNNDIAICIGSTPTTYEPYNGDTYELDLGTLKMRGIGTYEDYFTKNTGKNLAPTNWASNFVSAIDYSSYASIETKDGRNCLNYREMAGYGSYDTKNFTLGMTFKENTQYTLSLDIYKETSLSATLDIEYTDGSVTTISTNSAVDTWEHKTLTSTANKTIKNIHPRYTAGRTYIDINTWQIEEGVSATTYEPFGSGKWCKYNAIGKRVITNITSVGTASTGIKYASAGVIGDALSNGTIMCEKYLNSSDASKNNTIRLASSSLYIYDNRFTDSTTALSLLNGLEYLYPLAPSYLSLIESETLINQLDAIEKALGKDGQTNISQVNNDAPFIINASALMKGGN